MARPTQGCQRLGRVSVLLSPSNNSQRKIQTIVVVLPCPFDTRSLHNGVKLMFTLRWLTLLKLDSPESSQAGDTHKFLWKH